MNPLVPVLPFFASQILPELQTRTNSVLEADALKFACTFRRQLPREAGLTLFPIFARLLASDKYVVHTYAALCVERFLTIKDGAVDRYTTDDVRPLVGVLVGGLFKQVRVFARTATSPHNAYTHALAH